MIERLKGVTRVWIDHCSFSDGQRLDKQFPPVYAAPYNQPEQKVQHHDAAIDITKASISLRSPIAASSITTS